MNPSATPKGARPYRCGLWLLLLFGLLIGPFFTAQAQNVGDYRSLSSPVGFANTAGWQRRTATGWVANNTRALDFSKTFYVQHSKNIGGAGIPSTIGRIVIEPSNNGLTLGTLTVNSRLQCGAVEVAGSGAQMWVNSELANIGSTLVKDNGLVTLASEGRLGSVTVQDDGEVKLALGVTPFTVLGPTIVDDGGTLSVDADGPTFEALTVKSGGQMLVNAGVTLTEARVESGGLLVQLPAGAITISHTTGSTLPDLMMLGQFRNQSDSHDIQFELGASMKVGAGAVYTHSANGGSLPIAEWDPQSTLEIRQVVDASSFGNDNQIFGNVVWETPDYGTSSSGSSTFYLNSMGTLRIAGRLTVRSTGLGRLQLSPPVGSGLTTTWLGSYEQTGGQVCISRFGSSRNRVVNVAGNFTMSGGRFELSNTSSSGPGTLQVAGALELTNATLLLSGASANGTLDLQGDLLLNTGSTLRREAVGGTAAVRISGTSVQRFRRASSAAIVGAVNVAVISGATLDMADQTLIGSGTFTVNNGGALQIGHFQGISAGTSATGNIQVTGTRTFNAGATYRYTGTTNQITGNGLPATLGAGGRLEMDNSGSNVTLSQATQLAGVLGLKKGRLLTTNTNLLTMTPTATWQDASDLSYVAGPLARQTNNTAVVYTFPVGSGNRLKVAGVKPTANNLSTFRYLAYVAAAPSLNSLNPVSGLYKVSSREYWDLTRTVGTANATVRLYYTVPFSGITETTAALQDLRIAALVSGQWSSYGQATLPNTTQRYLEAGTAVALATNSVVSTTFGSTSDRNPLPVQLVEFRAKVQGSDVQLVWRTAQEKDCEKFEVQTSVDGLQFEVLSSYPGQGNSATPTSYGHLHAGAFASGPRVRYYRLRQVDFDGQFYFSAVLPVSATPASAAKMDVQAWPRPAADWLNVQVPAVEQGEVRLNVIDAVGRTCLTHTYPATGQPALLRLDVGQLHRGLYFVQVETKQGHVQVRFQKL
ncbi:hypothetical protein [Hymenobacter sp. B81]|uniref:hypothetical protein n=1 Tax=Hymenobacter sp. B81 TaxID=3344878 RepID=UPI0037DD9692